MKIIFEDHIFTSIFLVTLKIYQVEKIHRQEKFCQDKNIVTLLQISYEIKIDAFARLFFIYALTFGNLKTGKLFCTNE